MSDLALLHYIISRNVGDDSKRKLMYDQCHFFVDYDQITTTKYQTLPDAQQQNSEIRL